MKRLTKKDINGKCYGYDVEVLQTEYEKDTRMLSGIAVKNCIHKLGQLEDIMEKYGVENIEELQKRLDIADKYGELGEQLGTDDLSKFLNGTDPDTCFMQIEDKKFYFCGDAYYGTYSKEGLLNLIQELLFMYWALKKVQ